LRIKVKRIIISEIDTEDGPYTDLNESNEMKGLRIKVIPQTDEEEKALDIIYPAGFCLIKEDTNLGDPRLHLRALALAGLLLFSTDNPQIYTERKFLACKRFLDTLKDEKVGLYILNCPNYVVPEDGEYGGFCCDYNCKKPAEGMSRCDYLSDHCFLDKDWSHIRELTEKEELEGNTISKKKEFQSFMMQFYRETP